MSVARRAFTAIRAEKHAKTVIPCITSLAIPPPKPPKGPRPAKQTKHETEAIITEWIDKTYNQIGSQSIDYDQLSWLCDHATSLWQQHLRKNTQEVKRLAKFCTLPPPVSPDCKATQTDQRRQQPRENRKIPALLSPNQDYFSKKKKVFNQVTNGAQISSQLLEKEIRDHFHPPAPTINCAVVPQILSNIPHSRLPQDLSSAFSHLEVQNTINKLPRNSTPGPDSIPYEIMGTEIAPTHFLVAILNSVLTLGKIPLSWKKSRSILLHKGGDPHLAKQWRPIALQSSLLKLLCSLLESRLSKAPNLLSDVQKGFRQGDGSADHIRTISEIFQAARQGEINMALCSLDASNAFGCLPHDIIPVIMRQAGISETLINLITDLYTGATTEYVSNSTTTSPIPVTVGSLQGNPLSPFLFSLCLEGLIRDNKIKNNPIVLFSKPISILAFADDLLILAPSPVQLQGKVDRLALLASGMNLKFNPTKSLTTTFHQGNQGDPNLSILDCKVPTISDTRPLIYLGIDVSSPTSTHIRHSKDQITHLLTILKANQSIRPHIKIDMIATFIQSIPTHVLRLGFPKPSVVKKLSSEMTVAIKHCLDMPKTLPNVLIHGPKRFGALGLPTLTQTMAAATLITFLKTWMSKDETVRHITRESLRTSIAIQIGAPDSSINQALQYICSIPYTPKNISPAIRRLWETTHYLRHSSTGPKLTHLSLIATDADIQLSLTVSEAFADRPITITANNTAKTTGGFRKIIQGLMSHEYNKACQNLPGAGGTLDTFQKLPAQAPDTLLCALQPSTRLFRLAAMGHATKARADSVWLVNQTCRICRSNRETIQHILNGCESSLGTLATDRHNGVIKCLLGMIQTLFPNKYTIQEDETVEGYHRDLRPDLVLSCSGPHPTILDISCPFENRPTKLDEVTQFKIDKYDELAQFMAIQNPSHTVVNSPLIVGSLGTWAPRNALTLQKLKIPKWAANILRIETARLALEYSKYMYLAHIMNKLPKSPPPAPRSPTHLYRKPRSSGGTQIQPLILPRGDDQGPPLLSGPNPPGQTMPPGSI